MRNLEFLYQGNECAGLVHPQVNSLLLPLIAGGSGTDPGSNYYFKTASGGWMYIHIHEITGDSIMAFEAAITVDANMYDHWYSNLARWDSSLNPL